MQRLLLYFTILEIGFCLLLHSQDHTINHSNSQVPLQPQQEEKLQENTTPQILAPELNEFPRQYIPGSFDLSLMREIPVQYLGRVQPCEMFARLLLCQFSGRTTVNTPQGTISAIEWLMIMLFDPEQAQTHKIFLIENSQILDHLHIPYEKTRDRYSFQDLKPGLNSLLRFTLHLRRSQNEPQTLVDRQMLRLFQNIETFLVLNSTFSLFHRNLPHHPELLSELQIKFSVWEYLTFLHIVQKVKQNSTIQNNSENILDHKVSDFSPNIQRLWQVWQNKQARSQQTADEWLETLKYDSMYTPRPFRHDLFCAFPYAPQWMSSWKILSDSQLHSQLKLDFIKQSYKPKSVILLKLYDVAWPNHNNFELLQIWIALSNAYYNNSADEFHQQLQLYHQKIANHPLVLPTYHKVKLEAYYHQWEWLFWAKILCFASLLLCSISWLYYAYKKSFYAIQIYRLSYLILLISFIVISYALILRFMICGRPPVTNLYETMIFVAWFGSGMALVLEKLFHKHIFGLCLFSGGLLGALFILMSDKFAYESDSLGVLTAVLDSNFWLATHVTTITIGYASCLMAGAFAHFFIILNIFTSSQSQHYNITFSRMIYGILCFATIFTFLGTVLGGFWADQSWGRFWGWDPKENGALVLLLWNAVILHAYSSGYLREWGVALCAVFGNLIVAGAWWGVNLLQIGLHSYGFNTNIQNRLLYFVGIELFVLLIGSVLMLVRTDHPNNLATNNFDSVVINNPDNLASNMTNLPQSATCKFPTESDKPTSL